MIAIATAARAFRRARALVPGTGLGLALLVAAAAPAAASPIVLLGDSWGALIEDSVRSTLDANGHADLAIHNTSRGGSTAAQWQAEAFGSIPDLLAGDDDARLVHVILGGNDLIAGASDPLGTITQATADTLAVLREVALATPVPILFTGYDYLAEPIAGIPPDLVNLFLDSYVDGIAAEVAADPLLASRVTVENTHGLMQVHFGVPQAGIPPFDPSLPDPSLPGPSTAFADLIHLNRAGYDVLADRLYDDFYEPVLVPEPGATALVLAGLLALRGRSARLGA